MKNRHQLDFQYCRVIRTGNVSVANSTLTTVVFNSAANDPYGLLNTGTGEVTIKSPGYYAVNYSIWWDGETTPVSTGYRFSIAEVDSGAGYALFSSASVIRPNNASMSDTVHSVTGTFGVFEQGDKLRVRVQQASGETIVLRGGIHTRLSICQLPGKVQ